LQNSSYGFDTFIWVCAENKGQSMERMEKELKNFEKQEKHFLNFSR
jgi:hypothetical protein